MQLSPLNIVARKGHDRVHLQDKVPAFATLSKDKNAPRGTQGLESLPWFYAHSSQQVLISNKSTRQR
jgi:hypothetical protein